RADAALCRGIGVERHVVTGARHDDPVGRGPRDGLVKPEGRLLRLGGRRHAREGLAQSRGRACVAEPHPQPGVRRDELQAPAARRRQQGRCRAAQAAGHGRHGHGQPDGPARAREGHAAHRGAREPGRVRRGLERSPGGLRNPAGTTNGMTVSRTSGPRQLWPLAPMLLVQVALFVVPLGIMLVYSFWTTKSYQVIMEWTLANYVTFFQSATYPRVLLRTFLSSILITVITLLAAYPLAYFIVRFTSKWQKVLLGA